MCLGVPGRLVATPADAIAVVDIGGVEQRIDMSLLGEDRPAPGDWVLVHLGFAMSRMSPTEASEALDGLVAMGAGQDDGFDEAALFASWGLETPGTPR